MKGFTTIDLVILVVYLAAVLYAGLHFSKKEMKGKNFLKATVRFLVGNVCLHFATLLSRFRFCHWQGNSYGGTWILWFCSAGNADCDTAYHPFFFSCRSTANWILTPHIITWNYGSAARDSAYWER